jgi:hypothetical protein
MMVMIILHAPNLTESDSLSIYTASSHCIFPSTSIGKLKHSATVEFGAPIEYNVFRITPENPEGILLSKAMFSDMNVS